MSDDLSGFSMMDLFRMEAEERLAVLSQGLVALEGSARRPTAIEPLMRAAHSLKGAARVVGLDAAVRVAHAMEDCLVAAQKGRSRWARAAIDVAAARGGLPDADVAGAEAELGELAGRRTPARSSAGGRPRGGPGGRRPASPLPGPGAGTGAFETRRCPPSSARRTEPRRRPPRLRKPPASRRGTT